MDTDFSLIKRFNISIRGDGNSVLFFIHGYGCNQTMWRFIYPSFEKDHKIILIDLMGNGESDSSMYDYSKYSDLNGYAEDIVQISEYLKLENVILIGHSASSIIGALASIKKPSLFKAIVMVCPSPYYLNEDHYRGGFSQEDINDLLKSIESNYLGWTEAFAPVLISSENNQSFSNELANSFCRNNPQIALHFAQVAFQGDYRKDLPLISRPTLIIQSEHDSIAPTDVGVYMRNAIKNSRIDVVKTFGHCPHLTNPDIITKSISCYLEQINY